MSFKEMKISESEQINEASEKITERGWEIDEIKEKVRETLDSILLRDENDVSLLKETRNDYKEVITSTFSEEVEIPEKDLSIKGAEIKNEINDEVTEEKNGIKKMETLELLDIGDNIAEGTKDRLEHSVIEYENIEEKIDKDLNEMKKQTEELRKRLDGSFFGSNF